MRFGDLTYEEIKSYTDANALAIMPTGCTEHWGPRT